MHCTSSAQRVANDPPTLEAGQTIRLSPPIVKKSTLCKRRLFILVNITFVNYPAVAKNSSLKQEEKEKNLKRLLHYLYYIIIGHICSEITDRNYPYMGMGGGENSQY